VQSLLQHNGRSAGKSSRGGKRSVWRPRVHAQSVPRTNVSPFQSHARPAIACAYSNSGRRALRTPSRKTNTQ
jgi:hypothetical protein